MPDSSPRAELYLDGIAAGIVHIHGASDSWGYGEFHPGPEFSHFAPLFGAWSLLMHDDELGQLSPAASEELRQAEYAIDALKAELRGLDRNQTLRLDQLNIDGPLIEWKRR